jgi:hypothetical protein
VDTRAKESEVGVVATVEEGSDIGDDDETRAVEFEVDGKVGDDDEWGESGGEI